MELLRQKPSDPDLQTLINRVEQEHPADLTSSAGLLHGVWELRWSSSQQPWLKPTAGLENLQILDPVQGRGCNLLRLRAPTAPWGASACRLICRSPDSKRVAVRFRQGGWIGPSLPNRQQLSWMRVLDEQLRICRGNAGTTFALLKRDDLNLSDFLDV